MARIRFENVRKSFRDVVVLKGLDITIKDGEFFTFVGPSGCGKSTILNLIAGLEAATGGSIYFDGSPIDGLTPGQRDVAMVFQSYALYPHMSVYENLAFPLRMKGKKDIEPDIKNVAAMLGIEGLLGRRPGQLSGGQRQRVALGRAIIRRPRVFLMDEPLSNLDARLRVEMRAELKRLHRELKITTVYVTHDQAEAMGLSDRMAVLEGGEVRQVGGPLEVYSRPSNVFVAGFIGSPSMNLIEARVVSVEPFEVAVGGIRLRPGVEKTPEADIVTLGIRPEDLVVSAKEKTPIEAVAELTEAEGAVTWVNLRCDGIPLKGKAAADETISPAESVFLGMAADRLHVFDRYTGKRLQGAI